MTWYLERPDRLREERETIDSLIGASSWLTPVEWRLDNDARLTCNFNIVLGESVFPLSMHYPSHFPHSPPVVVPRGSTERWTYHQYGAGGELCLEWGPDNWTPEISGAAMIESAHRLLATENAPAGESPGEVESRHFTTLGQQLAFKFSRLVVTDALKELMRTLTPGLLHKANYTIRFRGSHIVYTIGSVELPEGGPWKDPSIPAPITGEGYSREVALMVLPEGAAWPAKQNMAQFRAALEAYGVPVPDVDYVVLMRGPDIRSFFLWKEEAVPVEATTIDTGPGGVRLDQSYVDLRQRKVAIVGCGSLGSKVAVSLARTGVNQFLLVDDDIMLPENLVRHALDWSDVGLHKVDALARRIKLVNPDAQCDVRPYRLGGQQSSGSIETLLETLAAQDLIVDASANGQVFNYLSAAVEMGANSLLWAEVFGGGFGGLVARHRKGLDPVPQIMRAQIEDYCREQGAPIERAARGYGGMVEGVPQVADDADVSVIAAHAARFAIDILIPRSPTAFPQSVYLIGLSTGWAFTAPFDTRPIDVGGPGEVVKSDVDPALETEERAFIKGLVQKLIRNAADSSSDNSSAAAE